MSGIQKPLTLLTIPKDIRLVIWDYVWPEVRHKLGRWCEECHSNYKGCHDSIVGLCQPEKEHTWPLFVNKFLYDEMLAMFYKAPIFFEACEPMIDRLRAHHYARIRTITFPTYFLACLGQNYVLPARLLPGFPELKTIILKPMYDHEPCFIDAKFYAPLIFRHIHQCLRYAGLDELPALVPWSEVSGVFGDATIQENLGRNADFQTTLGAIKKQGIELRFRLTCRVRVLEDINWPFNNRDLIIYDLHYFMANVIWDKTGMRLEDNNVPDFRAEWWFPKWQGDHAVFVDRSENVNWPFANMDGKFTVEVSHFLVPGGIGLFQSLKEIDRRASVGEVKGTS